MSVGGHCTRLSQAAGDSWTLRRCGVQLALVAEARGAIPLVCKDTPTCFGDHPCP